MRLAAGPKLAAIATAISLAALALPESASAKKYQMSGVWFIRNDHVFNPLQFAFSPTMTHHSLATGTLFGGPATQPFLFHFPMSLPVGPMTVLPVTAIFGPVVAPFISHTTLVIGMGLGIPNGPILGSGNVSATTAMTMGPGRRLQIPRHRFKKRTNLLLPWNGVPLQLTTNFTFDAPREKATLASMGGPGSQTWCPSNPVCLPGGPPPGSPPNNGRIIYRKGPRQFGGAMQMGIKGFGDWAYAVNATPRRVLHLLQGDVSRATTRTLVPGRQVAKQVGFGPGRVPAVPETEVVHRTPAFVTQPVMTSAGLIVTPGPKVTTMGMLTNTAGGPILRTFTEITTNYGLSFTTGTVFAQQITGTSGRDFFTVMGSDMRTILGAGNLNLVAGGLHRYGGVNGVPRKTMYASYDKVYLTLAPFVPSMSPAGAAAAGALMLLAVGYAVRRRVRTT